jgi:hydroxymethylbilane synthase
MKLRLGTRRSRLALAQAEEVAGPLRVLGAEVEVVPMVTSGDRGAPAESSIQGSKGLFVMEIVAALRRGDLDLAVHSAKDLPSEDPEGIVVGAVPVRADPFDVLVSTEGALRAGAVVGTSSLRRQAQLRRARPELVVRELRGNVDTRLAKLERGDVDALVLAAAGLARLGIAPAFVVPFPLEEMVPAPGQGTLAVQVRTDEGTTMEMVNWLDHPQTHRAFEAERALVARVGGGCALPLGAYAEDRAEGIRLSAVVLRPDGSDLVWGQAEAPTASLAAAEVAAILLAGGAGQILADVAGPGPNG